MGDLKYTNSEMATIATARALKDNKTVFVGVGMPIIAALLAQRTHAPHLTIIFEGGAVQPIPISKYLPFSPNDTRSTFRAVMVAPTSDLFFLLQKGHIDFGIISGAQIDQYGNVNTSILGDYKAPKVRLPGSGGACDIATLATNIIITLRHEKRRFVEKVDFITSPGNINEKGREVHGIIFGKPLLIITGLSIMDYHPELKKVRLKSLHPNVKLEQVLENMEFKPIIPDKIEVTDPPTKEELDIIRELDPGGRWVEHPK